MAKRDKGAKLSAWRRAAYAAARARGEDPRPNRAEMKRAFPGASSGSSLARLDGSPNRPVNSDARKLFVKDL